jgi:hypothetical protein
MSQGSVIGVPLAFLGRLRLKFFSEPDPKAADLGLPHKGTARHRESLICGRQAGPCISRNAACRNEDAGDACAHPRGVVSVFAVQQGLNPGDPLCGVTIK